MRLVFNEDIEVSKGDVLEVEYDDFDEMYIVKINQTKIRMQNETPEDDGRN